MWEAFQIVWCSTVTSVFLFLCTVLTLQTLYNLTEIRCEKSSLYTTVSIKKCLISFWVWFLALLSLLEYVWLRFACCGKGKKKDLKKKNNKHILSLSTDQELSPFAFHALFFLFEMCHLHDPQCNLTTTEWHHWRKFVRFHAASWGATIVFYQNDFVVHLSFANRKKKNLKLILKWNISSITKSFKI